MIRSNSGPDWATLGCLRFGLAFIIVCRHFLGERPASAFIGQVDRLDAYTSVFCFLIVSGYSIASSLEREPQEFWLRRWRRLAPVYYISALLALIVSFNQPASLATLLGVLLGMNAVWAPLLPRFGPTWSLTCELCYYAIAPALFRRKALTTLLMVASLGFFALGGPIDWPFFSLFHVAPRLLWLWLCGFLLYRYRDRPAAYAAFAVLLVCAERFNPNHVEDGAWVTLAVTGITFWAARRRWSAGNVEKTGKALGDISYPLYLSHVPLRAAFEPYWLAHPHTYLLSAVVLAAAIHSATANRKRPARPAEPAVEREPELAAAE